MIFGVPVVDNSKTVVDVYTWLPTNSPTTSPTTFSSRNGESDETNADTFIVLIVVPLVGGLLVICGLCLFRRHRAVVSGDSAEDDPVSQKTAFEVKNPVHKAPLKKLDSTPYLDNPLHNLGRSVPVSEDDQL